MNWDAIGAVAELLGAVGVIGSLLYLAGQIRAANQAASVHAKLESTRLMTDYLDGLIQHPELAELVQRGQVDKESLSREEYIRFSNMALKAFYYFSAGYFQFKVGTLRADDWHEQLSIIDYWLRGPATRRWWDKLGRQMFKGDFVAFVDSRAEIVEAAEAAPKN
jgi:hypothetical protein